MTEKKYYLTPEGFQRFKEEYENLKNLWQEKEMQLKESRDEIWRPEDLNPEFEVLQTELDFIEERMKNIEKVLENAKIIRKTSKTPSSHSQKVTIGKTVVVESDGKIDEFTIVGTMEANPSEGKISNESPLGKALIGKKIGETVTVKTPLVTDTYKILKIK